jgi:hypothetical protein
MSHKETDLHSHSLKNLKYHISVDTINFIGIQNLKRIFYSTFSLCQSFSEFINKQCIAPVYSHFFYKLMIPNNLIILQN